MTSELLVFNGRRYRRYPDSPRKSHRRYYSSGPKLLHREMYAFHHGEIPAGRQVWFADGNPDNLEPTNLILDNDQIRQDALERAADWHRSEGGREWHRQNMKNSLAKPKAVG